MSDNNKKREILTLLKKNYNGLSAKKISTLLTSSVSERTVQRWIKNLLEEGLVEKSGQGVSSLYQLRAIPSSASIDDQTDSFDIPLSKAAIKIFSYVSTPTAQRKKVYYNRVFVEKYLPNKTSYLSDIEKQELWEMSGGSIQDLPAGTYARRVMDRLLIDLSWNSSRLEGNTYSFLETERLLKEGKSAGKKSALDAQMILNHKEAIEYLIEEAENLHYDSYTIRNIHAILSDNLMGDPQSSGRIRTISIGIHGTRFQPSNVPALVEETLELILKKANLIENPFECAFFLMVHLPYLQPFEDVNKRTSRLAGNIPLLKNNLCPLSFVDVPTDIYIKGLIGVYEQNKIELLKEVFLWAYLRSTQRYAQIQHQIGEPDPFRMRHRKNIKFIVQSVVEKGLDRIAATEYIQDWAESNLEKMGRARFIEAIEQELLALNLGNIARYRLRPKVFSRWQKVWNRQL